jgi:hypothetical protein
VEIIDNDLMTTGKFIIEEEYALNLTSLCLQITTNPESTGDLVTNYPFSLLQIQSL